MIGFNRYTVEAQFDGTTWTALNTDIITDISFSYGIMDKRVTLRVYRSTSFTGKLKSPYGEPLTWLSASDCESIALPAPHRKILRRLVEHLHSGQLEV